MILSFSPCYLLLGFPLFGNVSAQTLRKGHDQSHSSSTVGQKDSTTTATNGPNSILPSDGVCWIHENGKLCFQDNSFQSISFQGDEIFFEEFLEDKKYSYSMENTEKLRNEFQSVPSSEMGNRKLAHALSDHTWLDSTDGVKYGCKVEDVEDEFQFNGNDKELLFNNVDGSSLWRFQKWTVPVDSDSVPISIMFPTEGDEDHLYDEQIISIERVEQFSYEKDTNGCDPDSKEGDESPEILPEAHTRYLEIMNAHDPSISDEDYFSNEEGHQNRKLDWLTDLQAASSNTNWCGSGTDENNTPCPSPNNDLDFYADLACRRHDHGKKVTRFAGIPRMECYVDKQLLAFGGHNWAVQAAFGNYGGMRVIGCNNYESYKCWRNWGWRTCGKKWKIKRGPSRYSGATNTQGYTARDPECYWDFLLW